MVTPEVNRILRRYKNDASDVIAILQDIQQAYRYLPQDVLETVSRKLDIPLSRIYHLATFFRAFSLEQRGEHELHVCMGTACHVRGATRILETLERKMKVTAGQTTKDLQFTLETVNCVGACALGPVVMADGKSAGKMSPQKAERLLRKLSADSAPKEKPAKGKAKKPIKASSGKKVAAASKAGPSGSRKKAPKKKKAKKQATPKARK